LRITGPSWFAQRQMANLLVSRLRQSQIHAAEVADLHRLLPWLCFQNPAAQAAWARWVLTKLIDSSTALSGSPRAIVDYVSSGPTPA